MSEIILKIGDCRELMKELDDESIDLILTDPPYNISNETVIIREGGKFGYAKPISHNFGSWDKNIIQPQDWIPLALQKLTKNGIFICFYDKEKNR